MTEVVKDERTEAEIAEDVRLVKRKEILAQVKKTGKCPKCSKKLIDKVMCKQHGIFIQDK